ncbi:MAG: flagellar biosynthesis anti-sigma factor FlgM [Pseudomonadota bacterium]
MSNEIDGVNSGGLSKIADVGGNRRVSADNAQSKQSNTEQTQANDTVALTDNARLLARVEAAVAEAPDVDSAKVEAVKSAIQDGSYQVDDRQIADKILRSDIERG